MVLPSVDDALRRGLAQHQSGQFQQAEHTYREILAHNPKCAPAWHLLGALALQVGRADIGAQMIENAIRLGMQTSDVFNDLGECYRSLNKLHQSASAFQRAIQIDPARADSYCNLGSMLNVSGCHAQALPLLEKAIQLRPDFANAHYQCGIALLGTKNIERAILQLREAVRLQPNQMYAMKDLGLALRYHNELAESLKVFNELATKFPSFHEGKREFAMSLALAGDTDRAVSEMRELIELQPNDASCHATMGLIYLFANHEEESSILLNRALELNPMNASLMVDIGKGYEKLARYGDAALWFERAFEVAPSVGLGHTIFHLHLKQNQLDSALKIADRTLSGAPQHVETHCNRSMALLALGKYLEGFAEYEWRAKLESSIRTDRKFSHPRWEGQDLAGKAILVHTEQGFGDVINFVRYVPMLAARGAKVIAEVPPELQLLLTTVPGMTTVVSRGQELPSFDFHSSLMSLARVFKTTVESIPNHVPYLSADRIRTDQWRPIIAEHAVGLKIGIVWGGNSVPDPKRSCSIKALSKLADVPNVSWYSLQYGDHREQLKDAPLQMRILDLGEEIYDFADTAAILSQLDLFITIDTAAAHLAGAMAIKTWMMLPVVTDWRWYLQEDSSPWYPTIRLFRQATSDDWTPVIDRIRTELLALVRSFT